MNDIDPYTPPSTFELDKYERPKRPVVVTVICILLWVGALVALMTLGDESNKRIASWYPAYNASYVIIQAACAIGMWLMKRWGFIGYIFLLGSHIAVIYAISQGSPWAVGVYLVICYILIRAMPSASFNTQHAVDNDRH